MTWLHVAQLWRYPVKSFGGEQLEEVTVSSLGLLGDRAFGLVDLVTGNVLTARREPRLLLAQARLERHDESIEAQVVITLPNGTETDDDTTLSSWLQRDVTLRRAGSEGGTYENPFTVDVRTEADETDWVSWTGPGGAWHDSPMARVSLVSTSAIGRWDVRRFRPNVVLAGEGEDGLVGAAVTIGTAVLQVTKQIDRCVMVTRPQPGLARDLSVLKDINDLRGGALAVGALVTSDGRIARGDRVTTTA